MTVTADGTTLWIVRTHRHQVACVSRLLRHGVQIEILFNGSLLMSRVFDTGDEALDWAEEKRVHWRAARFIN